MRALIALVTCVILLAVIQGSYLVIDAHHNPKNAHHVTDDADHEVHHVTGSEHHGIHTSDHNHQHQSSHHDPQPPSQKTEDSVGYHSNRGILSEDGVKDAVKVESTQAGCHGNKCTNSHKETEIELVPLDVQRNGSVEHRILYQTLEDQQQQQQQQQQQPIPYKHNTDDKPSGVETNLHIHKTDISQMNKDPDLKSYKPQGDRLLMSGMQGDMPLADAEIREHFLLDDPVRHQRDKNRSRGKRKECLTHDDCEQGDCCLTRHKGPSLCVTSRKEAGARCVDSCTCQQGLECFVAKVNKFGRPRRRNGRHPLLGKCQDPSEPTSVPGYWATYKPGVETSTASMSTTRVPIATTSTGPPRSRSNFMPWR